MTVAGWVFLVASWGAILGLSVFCLNRTFRKKP
jgi:hypothetical protein